MTDDDAADHIGDNGNPRWRGEAQNEAQNLPEEAYALRIDPFRSHKAQEIALAQIGEMLTGAEDMIPAVRNPANIHVLVAGGPGLYSMVMPSWCAGPHGNIAVHETIETSQYCELPAGR